MEEIRLRDEQLRGLTATVRQMLDGCKSAQDHETCLPLVNDRLQEFETAMHCFRIELKRQAPADKQVYKHKLQEHKDAYNGLKNQYEWKQTEQRNHNHNNVRAALVGDYKPTHGAGADTVTVDGS